MGQQMEQLIRDDSGSKIDSEQELLHLLKYKAGFAEILVPEFQQDGWEVRLENPPQAYMHVSRPEWGDERMNGIHLETYVLRQQFYDGVAPVALHCEGGSPVACAEFKRRIAEKCCDLVRSWGTGEWKFAKEHSSCSVFEVLAPLSPDSRETLEKLAVELRRLRTIGPMIDSVIRDLKV
ncbi:unnamed protein product [Amoebophrya sp. A25]|nr:unnamed protein product [Amoebophrya sp. A25]|eukprot:GSA25T00004573001.1